MIFVEVKTRTDDAKNEYGLRPADAVTYEKRERTLYAARAYLHTHPTEKRPRMDVIELYLQQNQSAAPKLLKLNWIQNAYRKH